MNKAAALQFGDTIRLVAPSSPPENDAVLHRAISALESLGFRIKYSNTILERNGYLAGSDEMRAADFTEAFEDTEAKGIVCVRGGYGSTRILSLIDWTRVAQHPKAFLGFSDTTALSCALWVKCQMPSFSGPVATSDLIGEKPDSVSWNYAVAQLSNKRSMGSLVGESFGGHPLKSLVPGKAEGRLMGGNLSLLCSLLGTPWIPDFEGAILFLEDVAEPTYRVDRYLTQLINAGVMDRINGILLGDFRYTAQNRKNDKKQGLQTMEDVFEDRLGDLGIPVLANAPFGHVQPKITIPFGVNCVLDVDRANVQLLESGVS